MHRGERIERASETFTHLLVRVLACAARKDRRLLRVLAGARRDLRLRVIAGTRRDRLLLQVLACARKAHLVLLVLVRGWGVGHVHVHRSEEVNITGASLLAGGGLMRTNVDRIVRVAN